MSIEVVEDLIEVVAVPAAGDVEVVADGSTSLLEVEVVAGDGDAVVEVVDAGGPEVVVDATATVEVEVVAQDTQPEVDHVIEIIAGPRGPEGPAGPQGPAGPAGEVTGLEALAYVHTQSTPEAVWTITHNLPFHPNVTVVDSAGTAVEGGVEYLDATALQVYFAGAFSGTAYLS